MELTPKLLTDDVDFRITFRGYDQDEVDDFLERVAEAVGQLLDQLGQAVERARNAESRLQKAQLAAATSGQVPVVAPKVEPAPEPVAAAAPTAEADVNEELGRALLLAQRTADAVVAEAHDDADRITADAEAAAAQLLADTDAEARRRSDDAKVRLLREVDELERVREGVRGDVSLLERHLGEQRARLRETVQILRRVVEDPKSFESPALPDLSGATVPADLRPSGDHEVRGDGGPDVDPAADSADASDASDTDAADAGAHAEAQSEVTSAIAGEPATEAGPATPSGAASASPASPEAGAPSEVADADVEAATPTAQAAPSPRGVLPARGDAAGPARRANDQDGGATPSASAPPAAPRPAAESTPQLDLRTATDRTARSAGAAAPADAEASARHDLRSLFNTSGEPSTVPGSSAVPGSWRASDRLDQGPHTQPVATTRVEDEPDDAFLAELRKAMTEDEPLGPRDNVEAVPFAAPQPQPRTTRFGRRR